MVSIRDALGLFPCEGDLGVEIEIEGTGLPEIVKGFTRVEDGSLRGEESGEYVFTVPQSLRSSQKLLNRLNRTFKTLHTTVDESYRTSVHVHVNVQKLTLQQLYNMIILYFIFEDQLVEMCGPTRKGNQFCLRRADAEGLIHYMIYAATTGRFTALNTDDLRYQSVNITSVFRYGSLEFRGMRGITDTKRIIIWAALLLRLRKAAMSYGKSSDIVLDMSRYGIEDFTKNIFGADFKHLPKIKDWEASALRNARELQILCYTSLKSLS